uniref:Septin-7 n=1 Tax=Sinocyclocheilus anshuiensis TaxID=1608454 RepID=A0A671RNW9_9TELE
MCVCVILCLGESGLGKSTLVNSLFLTNLYIDRCMPDVSEKIARTVSITKNTVDIVEDGVNLRLTVIDTPGFGDALNNHERYFKFYYVDQEMEKYRRNEIGLNRKNITDNRVHCCLYFISPHGHGLKPIDVNFMKALDQKVNIVPVLAKADSLTPKETHNMKSKILTEIDKFKIKIFQVPDSDPDNKDLFKQQTEEIKRSIPFAVIGSNAVAERNGRRVRARVYPWGIVETENPSHSDFVHLRNMLIRTHMQDLIHTTHYLLYENYRSGGGRTSRRRTANRVQGGDNGGRSQGRGVTYRPPPGRRILAPQEQHREGGTLGEGSGGGRRTESMADQSEGGAREETGGTWSMRCQVGPRPQP